MNVYISRREKFCYILLAAFTFVWTGAFSLLGMDLHHDGIMFKTAADIAAGKWLFRETFCQYGILSPLLQGAMLKVFGMELAVLKLGTALFYAAIVILNDLIWRRFLSLPYRILNTVMFFVLAPYLVVTFHIWSSVYALFCMLLGTELMLLAEERGKKIFLCLAGVSSMLAFGFRWPCGAVMLTAQSLILLIALYGHRDLKKFKTDIAAVFAGAGCIAVVYALYITAGNAWHDYLLQNFSFTSKFAWERGGSGSFSRLISTFLPYGETINYIFIFIPLAAAGSLISVCCRSFRDPGSLKKQLPLITVLLCGLASYHQYYPVPCVRHLYWGALPMFGAYVLLIRHIAESHKFNRLRKVLFILLLLIPLLWGGGIRMYNSWLRISEFFTRQARDLAGVRYIRHGAGERHICDFALDIGKNMPEHLKKRGVFNHTADGIWSVLLPSCPEFKHPMFVNWGNTVYPDYQAKVLEYVNRNFPAVLSSAEFYHPFYVKVFTFQYMGVDYTLWIPAALR